MIGWRTTLVACAVLAACNGEEGPSGPATAEISVESLAFGAVPVGTSAEQTVTLSNTGGEELEIRSVSLVSGDDSVWRWSREPDGDVPAGGSIELIVTFSPDVPDGEEAGRLQIRTSDTDTGPLTIDLTGSGAPSTVDGDEDGFSPADGDCNDSRADTYPGAPELCDGRDNDCDGTTPADEDDGDRDGVRVCDGDCDDEDDAVYPGAPEICDDKDSDCDGSNPDRADADDDGFSICDDDCDDDDPDVSPGLPEICDGLDNDCSGAADDIDADGDGRSVCRGDCDDDDEDAYSIAVDPGANPETPDGTDAAPYGTIAEALANLEPTCSTVYLYDADYAVDLSFTGGETVRFVGESVEGTSLTPVEEGSGRVLLLDNGADVSLRTLTVSGGASEQDGGAILSSDSELTLEDVVLRDNSGGADGGALALSSGRLTLRDVVARDNTAADDGGAIAVFSGTLDASSVVLEGNSGNRGGAVLVEAGSVLLDGATIRSNTARDSGGGLQLVGGSSHLVQRSRFAANTATTEGGALALAEISDADSVFRNLVLTENDGGGYGGGVAITGTGTALTLANNTIVGNAATEGGAGIHVASTSSSVDVVANIVGWSDGGSGIEVQDGSGADVRYCLAFATSPGADFAGGASVDGEGNQSDNPLFTSWDDDGDPFDDDDLRLESGSPALDAGPPDSAFDDSDGSQNDLGHTGGPGAE